MTPFVGDRRYLLAMQRRRAGYSQEALAEALEVGRSTIVRWEAGEAEPRPRYREALAKTLEISLETLNRYVDDEPVSTPQQQPPTLFSQSDIGGERPSLPISSPPREGDDVHRREFLGLAAPLVGSMSLMPDVAGLLFAPMHQGFDERHLTIDNLVMGVDTAGQAWAAGRSDYLKKILPILVKQIDAASDLMSDADRQRLA